MRFLPVLVDDPRMMTVLRDVIRMHMVLEVRPTQRPEGHEHRRVDDVTDGVVDPHIVREQVVHAVVTERE